MGPAELAAAGVRLPQRLVRAMAGVSLPERPFGEVIGERVRLVRLLGLAPRPLTAVLLTALAVGAAGPAAMAVATGVLVGAVVGLATGPGSGSLVALVGPLGLFAGVLVAQQLAELVSDTAGQVASKQIDRQVRRKVRQVALAPTGVAHLEDPAYQDELRRGSDLGASWRVRSPGTATTGQVLLLFRLLATLAAAALVAQFSVLVAAVLLVVALLVRAIVRTQWMELQAREEGFAGEKRKVTYWMDLAARAPAAKEVRLFGLGGWVVERRYATELAWIRQLWRDRQVVYWRQAWVAALAVSGLVAGFLPAGLATLSGTIGVDDLARLATATLAVLGFSRVGLEQFDIEHGIGAVRAFDRLTARTTSPGAGTDPGPATAPPPIRFDQVSFRYPGGEAAATPVLSGLDLELRPGEVTAVVGVNGAGKTTMMKLLAGLYQPTGGRVTVAGVDLATVDLAAWRRRLSILFQDFVHYPLSADRNVSLGAGDVPLDPELVRVALRDAGAADLVAGLPAAGDTPLTRTRTGGTDLSGGQWQRLALARVLYAVRQGARVVVLDEPTAHLDVTAEAAFFDEVIARVTGVSVVLISHRMSTVRHADRIVLLEHGRITESGNHAQLLAAGGEYARLFRLQAARFTEDAQDLPDPSPSPVPPLPPRGSLPAPDKAPVTPSQEVAE